MAPAILASGSLSTSLVQLCNWISDSSVGTGIRESDNLFSAIETVHVLGIVAVVGTIAIVDLRLLGFALEAVPVSEVVGPLVRITWLGFAVMLASGALLFWAEAAKLYGNTAFRLKLALLVLAAANAWAFHAIIYPRCAEWDADARTPAEARIAGLCSLALWSAIIACGRAIAYR